jgi:hypothetical protein
MAKVTLSFHGKNIELDAPASNWDEMLFYLSLNWREYDITLLKLWNMLLDDGSMVEATFDPPLKEIEVK